MESDGTGRSRVGADKHKRVKRKVQRERLVDSA